MIRPVRRGSASRVVAPLLLVVSIALAAPVAAGAHGGLSSPPTRTYVCRFLEPHAKQCEKAWAANSQALYDWMEINISNANGHHRDLIPDGKLCGAGRDKYGAFNAATDAWPSTRVKVGPMKMTYTATAPHATLYYRMYLTKTGFDVNQPLRWADLDKIYDSGPLTLAPKQTFPVTLPARTGHQILYLVWQRSDSQEAFYGCSDVLFPGGPSSDHTPVITHPTTTDPEAGGGTGMMSGKPMTPAVAKPGKTKVVRRGHLTFFTKVSSDWGGGYCADVRVKNTAGRALIWRASLTVPGKVTSLWSAKGRHRGKKLTVKGMAYNARLAPKQSTTFGYCVTRTAARSGPRGAAADEVRILHGLTAACKLD
jgi:predicted carbohydrate-binding protein with CBM5 and CBM33 domain